MQRHRDDVVEIQGCVNFVVRHDRPLGVNIRSVVKVHSEHIQQKHRVTLRLGARADVDVDHPGALLLGGVRVVGNHQSDLSLFANVLQILTTTVRPRAKRSDATAVAEVTAVSKRRKVAAAAVTHHIFFMQLGANQRRNSVCSAESVCSSVAFSSKRPFKHPQEFI